MPRTPDEQESVIVTSPTTTVAVSLSDSTGSSTDHIKRRPSVRDLFIRKGKRKIGFVESLVAIVRSSWLNFFVILIPLAWASHFTDMNDDEHRRWGRTVTFFLSFLSILPLTRFLGYGGEQLAFYVGKDLGNLIRVTCFNAVEATLAIILLIQCELTVLKSTVIGGIVLHLLLVPGISFFFGGTRMVQQDLHPQTAQLNISLLTIGVLAILTPTTFFAALDTPFNPSGNANGDLYAVTDEVRNHILSFSRGLAVLLLVVYIGSRIYLHKLPNEVDPEVQVVSGALKAEEDHFLNGDPEVNQYVCIVALVIVLGLMGATGEWLVVSAEAVRNVLDIEDVWFGLIFLPFVSYAADGTVTLVYFIRRSLSRVFSEPSRPTTLAHGESIDLSIQFALFWMPFLILFAWATGRPFTLLFDLFEVAVLFGACFLVNYVTADAKTNWAEGMSLVVFYLMIGLAAWYYTGQPELEVMSQCDSVEEGIQMFLEFGSLEG